MANLTTPIPPKLNPDAEQDLKKLREWGVALIDELTYLFDNLDASNVSEAASVKAENIDTEKAKIENAQIGFLSADKLKAGTVDTDLVTITDKDGTLEMTNSQISIGDGETQRFLAAYNKNKDKFDFLLYNKYGEPTLYLNSDGNAIFTGTLEGSTLYGSTIIGTDSLSYKNKDGGVFACLDPMGVKILHDQDNSRLQKCGITVGEDGTAYLVLGAGNGRGKVDINGITYTNGSFKVEKNDEYAVMGLNGLTPHIFFWEDSQELWLSGDRVLINGIDLSEKIDRLEQRLDALGV